MAGLGPQFYWLEALDGGTWYCSGPGCPLRVLESFLKRMQLSNIIKTKDVEGTDIRAN